MTVKSEEAWQVLYLASARSSPDQRLAVVGSGDFGWGSEVEIPTELHESEAAELE